MNRNRLAFLLKAAVSLGLLALLYRRINLADLGRTLAAVDGGILAALFGLLAVNTVLSAWKWRILLLADDIRVPLPRLVASYLVGSFFNLFLPSSIGGDVYRVMDVGRHSAQTVRSLAAVFADRLTGFIALVLFGALFSALYHERLPDPRLALLPVAVFVLLAGGLALICQQRLLFWGLRITRLDRFAAIRRFLEKFLGAFQAYGRSPRTVVQAMAVSFIFQFTVIVCIHLLARALGADIPFAYVCLVVPIITLAEALPISIFGLGIRDGAYAYFFIHAGLAREQALAMALLYVLVNALYASTGGLVFLLRRPAAGAVADARQPSTWRQRRCGR